MSGAIGIHCSGDISLPRDEALGVALRKTLTSHWQRVASMTMLAVRLSRYQQTSVAYPHFEKMADDKREAPEKLSDAYSLLGVPILKKLHKGITASRKMSSPPDGGFYASRYADVTPDDEEDTSPGLTMISKDCSSRKMFSCWPYFLHDKGMMHHDSSKRYSISTKVLRMWQSGRHDAETAQRIIDQGKKKLLSARETRTKPFIDTALYSSLNGMYISAFLKAYRVLGDEYNKGFALKSLERILADNTNDDNLLHTPGVKGLLDDHIHLIDALVSAYEVTGNVSYVEKADLFMARTIELFWDDDEGGFFDTDEEVLGTRLGY